MSIGYLLFWWILAGAVFQIIRSFRDPSTEPPSWSLAAALVAGLMGLVALVQIDLAGVLGLFLWTLFLTAPRSVLASLTRVIQEGHFNSARRRAWVVVVLHPSRGHRKLLSRLGVLSRYGTAPTNNPAFMSWASESALPAADYALLEFLTERGEWAFLLEWIEVAKSGRAAGVPASVFLPFYFRAIAESHGPEELLRAIASTADFLENNPRVKAAAHVIVSAFFGAPAELQKAQASFGKAMSEERRKFWHATALLCSDNVMPAQSLLLTLEKDARAPSVRAQAKVRLEQLRAGLFPRQAEHLADLESFFQPPPAARKFRPLATYVLVAMNVGMFLLVLFTSSQDRSADLYRWGMLVPSEVQEGGWWRILAAAFLHANFLHIMMNMVALVLVGSNVEYLFGKWRFLSLYFTTAIASNGIVTILVLKGLLDTPSLVGASGAVMGMIGISAAEVTKEWFRERSAYALRRLSDIAIALLIQVAFDLTTRQVSFTAHAAGLITGFVLGAFSKRP